MKMPEYVAVKIMSNKKGTSYSLEVVADTDFVNVVRCKDCKWCRLYQLFGTDNYQCERNALSAYFWVEPTDYCSYGERREVQRNLNTSNTLDALEKE